MNNDVLATIETFYECVGNGECAENGFDHQRAISAFSRATDDTGLCLVDITVSGRFKLLAYANIPEASMMMMMLNGPWTPENHGILKNFEKIPVGVPLLSRAIQADEDFYASDLYKMAMKPWNLHSIGVSFLQKGPLGGVLNGFTRNSGQREIDHEILSRLAILNKHLLQAMQMHERLDRLSKTLILTNNALDLIGFGLVVHDTYGKPTYANTAARRIFESADGVSLTQTGISLLDGTAQNQFHKLLETLSHPDVPLFKRAGGTVRVRRPSGKKPYSLIVAPIMGEAATVLEGVSTVVFVLDPEEKPTMAVNFFVSSFDLSPAEATLARALVEGMTLADFSSQRGISRNTAKSQLHSIFAKTETSRQSELVSLLLRSAAGIDLQGYGYGSVALT